MRWMTIAAVMLSTWAFPAAADDEEQARNRLFLGINSFNVGEYDQAIANLDQALELDPSLCRAHYYLARAHLGLGTAADIQIASSVAQSYEECATEDGEEEVKELHELLESAEPLPIDVVPDPPPEPITEPVIPSVENDGQAQYQLRRNVGTGMLVGGLVLCAGGIVGNIAVANYGYQNRDDDQLYEAARQGSNGLLVAGIAGGGVAVTGLMLLVIPEQKFSKVAVVPGPVTTVTVRF